jgi:hypothetical protein
MWLGDSAMGFFRCGFFPMPAAVAAVASAAGAADVRRRFVRVFVELLLFVGSQVITPE